MEIGDSEVWAGASGRMLNLSIGAGNVEGEKGHCNMFS